MKLAEIQQGDILRLPSLVVIDAELVADVPDGGGDHEEVGEFHERGDDVEVAQAGAVGAFGSELESGLPSMCGTMCSWLNL